MIAINNKTVLVTGANRGIGKTLVASFLNAGATKVYAAVRKLESAQPLVAEFGDRVHPIQVDLQDFQSVKESAKAATDVEIVVNNAGALNTSTALEEKIFADLDFQIDVNVKGLLRVAQAFAPVLKANGGGALVQINSVASLKSFPAFAGYAASKAASYSFTQALRNSLAGQGTLVVSVHPGPIATDMAKDAGIYEIAEPPAIVAQSIIAALEKGEFHAFPDAMARQMGSAYQSFSESVILPDLAEA